MKIQCKVCDVSPIEKVPDITKVDDGDEVRCSNCDKWLARAHRDEYGELWSFEDEIYATINPKE